jgi:DNA primase
VLVLCLDADRAGQDAMLRAAQLTDRRNLELRVVALPDGTDPAELIERAGADALRERVAASVPFVKFHVERILEGSDLSSAEGRDRAFGQLQPALRDLPKTAFGQALLQRVAGKLELSETRLARLIESSARRSLATTTSAPGNGAAATGRPLGGVESLDHGARAERTFLALCVALPQAGARTLFEIDPEQLITSELMRRAARHLAGRTQSPLADLPAGDDELARAVADLVAQAGRAGHVTDDQLEHARLVLEQARLDRAIRRAKTEGGTGIAELAREREAVMAARRTVYARLEKAV